METVTAVKIQIEYENPLNKENPRTAIARLTNPRIKNGPVWLGFSVIIRITNTTKSNIEINRSER